MKEKKKLLQKAIERSLGTLARHFTLYITTDLYKVDSDAYIEVLFVPPRSGDYLLAGVGEIVYSAEGDFSVQKALWTIREQLHAWKVI